ncbi:MAG TPA: hypothetical protein VLX29_08955 [Nitrospirota bacterium]|nr:hypothetical protein [Nitrospirota bacterium]
MFSSSGMGYIVYGKRQRRGVAILPGIALMAFPYIVSSGLLIVLLIGVVLMPFPHFIRY